MLLLVLMRKSFIHNVCTVLSIVSTPTIFPDCSASHHVSGSINNGGLSLRGFSPTVQCTRSASFPQLRDLSSFFSVKRTEFLYNYCEQEQDFIHLLWTRSGFHTTSVNKIRISKWFLAITLSFLWKLTLGSGCISISVRQFT